MTDQSPKPICQAPESFPATVSACNDTRATNTDVAYSKDAYRGVSSKKPSLHAVAASGAFHHAASEGNSDDPTRTEQAPGAIGVVPGGILTFVATWIAPPVRVPVVRDFTFKAVVGEPSW